MEKCISHFRGGFAPNLSAVLIGVPVIVFMCLYPKKWNAVVPSSLVAIVLATAAAILWRPEVDTVGAIPSSLLLEDRFSFADFTWANINGLLAPAVSIAALGMVESLLCGASAGRMTGVPLANDRELVAQGVGNILAPMFGGILATAAIARTSVAIKSGAQTRLTGMLHSVALLGSMLALGLVMARIPLSTEAGFRAVVSVAAVCWYIFLSVACFAPFYRLHTRATLPVSVLGTYKENFAEFCGIIVRNRAVRPIRQLVLPVVIQA